MPECQYVLICQSCIVRKVRGSKCAHCDCHSVPQHIAIVQTMTQQTIASMIQTENHR